MKFGTKRKKNRDIGILAAVIFLFSFLFTPLHASAQIVSESDLDPFGEQAVDEGLILASTDFWLVATRIIQIILGLLGIILLGLILYAGYNIMTSGGNEEKITKGKKTLINAIIGLIIILSAFAIAQFIINALSDATGAGGIKPSGGPIIDTFGGSGALGKVIKDHYPLAGQKGVARNTKIAVTFKVPIDASSFIKNTNNTCWDKVTNLPVKKGASNCATDAAGGIKDYYGDCTDDGDGVFNWEKDCDHADIDAIKIFQVDKEEETLIPEAGLAAMTTYNGDGNAYTFVFKPITPLGSDTEEMGYTVELMNGKKDGNNFLGVYQKNTLAGTSGPVSFGSKGKYTWSFQTSKELDEKPPTVVEVLPAKNDVNPETILKDTIISVTFSEAMDPLTVQGIIDQQGSGTTLPHILFDSTTNNTVLPKGEWIVSNGYTSIEFFSYLACGTNTCGQTKYCIQLQCPETDSTCTNGYLTLLRTAQLIKASDKDSFEGIPFTGITDMAGNALDGNANAKAEGHTPIGDIKKIEDAEKVPDNFWWNFIVQNNKDTIAPYIQKVSPGLDEEDVDKKYPTASTTLQFSKLISITSLGDLSIQEYWPGSPTDIVGKDKNKDDVQVGDIELGFYTVAKSVILAGKKITEATIKLSPVGRTFGPYDLDFYYFTAASSTVQDKNQNCLYPGRGPYAAEDISPVCSYNQDTNTGVQCVPVEIASPKKDDDTGCVIRTKIDYDHLESNIPLCISKMKESSK